MEIEIALKIIGALLASCSAGKIIYDIRTVRKSRLQEDYKFAKQFLEEIRTNPNLHPFAIEKGYQAIAGSVLLSSEEIAYLLSLKNPVQCLNDYLLSKKCLQALEMNGDLRLTYKKKYLSPKSRKLRKRMFFFVYMICLFLMFSPFFVPQYPILLFITIPAFGYYAWLALDAHFKIVRAEHLVGNQEKHTQLFKLPSGMIID